MAKKKKPLTKKNKEFAHSPFSHLKGFAVAGQPQDEDQKSAASSEKPVEGGYGSFAEEMELLGVERLEPAAEEDEPVIQETTRPRRGDAENGKPSEDEVFLAAMGEIQVRFRDRFPEEDEPQVASARRKKQLRQGKLVPEASLDLHGLLRSEVAGKMTFFLQDARYQGWRTVLVITGKGLHSASGKAALRQEAERFLQDAGRQWVVEWQVAPARYGGAGALVLFLRSHERT